MNRKEDFVKPHADELTTFDMSSEGRSAAKHTHRVISARDFDIGSFIGQERMPAFWIE